MAIKKKKSFLVNLFGIQLTVVSLILLAVLVVAVIGGISFVRTRAESEVRLTLTAGTNVLETTKTVKLLVNAGTNKVSFARVEVSFDKSLYALTGEIQTGNALKTIVQKTSMNEANETGKIVLAVGASVNDRASLPSGVVDLGTFVISKKVANATDITTDMSFVTQGVQIVTSPARALTVDAPALRLTLKAASATAQPTSTANATARPSATAQSTSAPSATTVQTTLIPVADTASAQNEPNATTFGNRTTLPINGGPKNNAYLRFELGSLAGKTVSRALLRVRVAAESSDRQELKDVAAVNWGEYTLTYNNRPSLGSSFASLNGGKVGEWKEVDITSYIQSRMGKTVSFAFDQTGGNSFAIYSREASDKPQLIVTYR